MVSIPSCHDGHPGSIPGRRAPLFLHYSMWWPTDNQFRFLFYRHVVSEPMYYTTSLIRQHNIHELWPRWNDERVKGKDRMKVVVFILVVFVVLDKKNFVTTLILSILCEILIIVTTQKQLIHTQTSLWMSYTIKLERVKGYKGKRELKQTNKQKKVFSSDFSPPKLKEVKR